MSHANTLIQSGIELFVMSEDGASSEIEVPSTITVSDERTPRFDVDHVHAVMVNSVTQPLIIDDAGIALVMSPTAPTAAATVAVGAAGSLSGTFYVKYTFLIRDLDGTIIAESGFSPVSASVVLTSDKLAVSALQTLSGYTVATINPRYEIIRRVYRTSNGTTTYFQWYDVEDNSTTTFEDDASDASLAALAAPTLGTAPFLSNVASFRDRLFGVNDAEDRDDLLYSETGRRWAWPSTNLFPTPQIKGDIQSGITALMPRRDALGLAKSNMLLQLTGTDEDDFRIVTLSTSIGAVNQEVVAKYRDDIYFLGKDGVYVWTDAGNISSVSDGKVRSWFTTDTYFNRDYFDDAFAIVSPTDKKYLLFLPSAGSTTIDSWVELNLDNMTWWGPHVSSAYTFTSAITMGSHYPLIGLGTDDGYIAVETDTRSDDATDAIITNATLAPIRSSDPPVTTYWGNITTEVETQAAGTLSIYPVVGEAEDSEETAFSHDMATASVNLGRLGYGRYVILRLYHATISQIVQLLGFEINPVNTVGRRQ